MKAQEFQQLVPFLGAISRELAHEEEFRLTLPRFFALVVICNEGKGTKDALQTAARELPAEVATKTLRRLRHRARANQVLRDLWKRGLLTRVEPSTNRSPVYYPSQPARKCLRAYRRRARKRDKSATA